MKSKKKFYVTTPIYYPSGKPHIGSAYTTIAADILARWHKLQGEEVFFLTGTDEHTKKVVKAAEKEGMSPKEYTDYITPIFKESWKKLNIEYSRFIRTSDKDHEKFVEHILREVFKKGDIYSGVYDGLYCFECEAYYTEKECSDKICPVHKKPLDNFKEETYFFKLSKYQEKLLKYYKKNPEFISPTYRKNEILKRVKGGLRDISISRKNEGWGIPLPFDNSQVAFVWFDALTNYVSGIGIQENKKHFEIFWPADIHLVGKDILWFHAVIWPAMLFAADIELPKKVFAHGWWMAKDTKIGKSSGNALDLDYLISTYGADSIRYFLFREVAFGQDGDFSEKALVERHNNELADKLGNLVSRTSALAENYGIEKTKNSLIQKLKEKKIDSLIENYELDKALNEIFAFIDKCNEYIQEKKPWETHDKKVLFELVDSLRALVPILSPFIPESAEKIAKVFKTDTIKKAPILFKKIETLEEKPNLNKESSPKEIMEGVTSIEYSDFAKVDLRVAKITQVEDIPGADKLYKLSVDVGEKRTICAGIKPFYDKEELLGKSIIIVKNLAPRIMRGIESQGMLLAASSSDHKIVSLLSPDQELEPGSKVS